VNRRPGRDVDSDLDLRRKTLAWEDAAAVERELMDCLRPKVEVWNRTFNLEYREFRHRVKQIALSNWRAVRNAVVAAPQDAPPGALVVPVDDDDSFARSWPTSWGGEFDAEFPCYLWSHYTVEPRRPIGERLRLAAWRLQGGRSLTCSTNNYAVIKSPEGPACRALWRVDKID
jgi:hypothetical protein